MQRTYRVNTTNTWLYILSTTGTGTVPRNIPGSVVCADLAIQRRGPIEPPGLRVARRAIAKDCRPRVFPHIPTILDMTRRPLVSDVNVKRRNLENKSLQKPG